MALPSNGQAWPPAQLHTILPHMGVWSAWYAGDSDQLASVYGGATGSDPTQTGFFASDHGGFRATVGRALTRWFWGEASRGPDRRVKLHVPIGAELCQASADLLFAEPATIKVDDEPTQNRINELVNDQLHNELAEAAEVSAALGGVYLRVTWDTKNQPDAPFVTHVDADQAIPEFSWGRLTAVTFWHVVGRDGKTVWRHLERHETDANGIGIILHGLYQGDADELGVIVPLTDSPVTAGLSSLVNAFGFISSESEGLSVIYVPNQTPNRRWRTDALGRNLGRSDLDGVEQLMDALDEVMTSWMRDVRLGKSRIMIAKSLLNNVGTGQGSAFNAEQEAYAAVNMLGNGDGAPKLSDMIEQVQFKIRVQEHRDTYMQLVQDILRMAGYSSETFGLYEGGGAVKTATEVEAKQQRSLLTRDRKIRLWRPAIAELIRKLLAVDQALFRTAVVPSLPDVNFTDGVQESQLSIAQTVLALRGAEAASDEVIVGMVHPDWEADEIDEEVARIKAARDAANPPLPDPLFMNGDANGAAAGPDSAGTGKSPVNG